MPENGAISPADSSRRRQRSLALSFIVGSEEGSAFDAERRSSVALHGTAAGGDHGELPPLFVVNSQKASRRTTVAIDMD